MFDHINVMAVEVTGQVAALENAVAVHEAWRPRIEGSIKAIRSSVEDVKTELLKVS